MKFLFINTTMKKGNLVIHKTNPEKKMVIIGFAENDTDVAKIQVNLKGYKDDPSLPFVFCEYIENCDRKVILVSVEGLTLV